MCMNKRSNDHKKYQENLKLNKITQKYWETFTDKSIKKYLSYIVKFGWILQKV